MHKLITCIASEDRAKQVVIELESKFNVQSTISYFARGFGRSAESTSGKLGQQTEKVIISALVDTQRVDEIFAFMYHAADLDRPHGGLIYVTGTDQTVVSPGVTDTDIEKYRA